MAISSLVGAKHFSQCSKKFRFGFFSLNTSISSFRKLKHSTTIEEGRNSFYMIYVDLQDGHLSANFSLL